MSLEVIVKELIESKREDDNWDFKEKWHDNNAHLLHDILCFANNRVNKDCYLIFGVRDKTYEIIGVENSENRKNQQNVIDFLKTIKFVSGIRPDIEVKKIFISEHELDILIIKNSFDTPYFLLEDYRDKEVFVRKYYIYTRVKDTNTPINSIADIDQIEYLWKKRFLLTESPINRIFQVLEEKEHWIRSYSNGETFYYYKFNPEYTLIINEENEDLYPEFYSMVMINDTQSYLNLSVKYFNTIVFQCQLTYLDGARLLVPTPDWGFISELSRDRTQGGYKYYIKDENLERLLRFFYDSSNSEESYAKERFDEVVLYFSSKQQKKSFEEYIKDNVDEVNSRIDEEIENLPYIKCSKECETKYMKIHIATGKVLNEYLEEFVLKDTQL